MKLVLLGLFMLMYQFSFAQSSGLISGTVHNPENKVLEKATVSVLNKKDSTVVSYTLTDEKGNFRLVKLPVERELLLYISHISGQPFQQTLSLKDHETKNMGVLKLSENMLEEVSITSAPPIRMSKDTLEYNTAYFKTRPNANVEELLKQLPGLQVNMDGTIYYQGKEVSSVKVNGKDFFATDLKIATRNLDASLIKTVQVYRDKGESKRIVENEEHLPVTINLKFKKDFLKADFGKVYGSGGTRKRYEAGGLFNTFRDTLQLSFIGFGNNINRQSFDYGELQQHAGLGRAENYGFDNFGGRNYWGIGNDVAGGFNLNNDWGKKTKLNLMYMLSYNNNDSENRNSSTSLYDGEKQLGTYFSDAQSKAWKHNIKTLLRHRFDTTAYFEFTPRLQLENTKNKNSSIGENSTESAMLNRSENNSNRDQKQLTYEHGFFIEKQITPNHVVSFRNNLNINSGQNDNINEQIALIYKQNDGSARNIWQNMNAKKRSNTFGNSFNYGNKTIKKLNFELYFTFNTSGNRSMESLLLNKDNTGTIRATELENSYRYRDQDYISGVKFYWKPVDKLSVNFGTAYQTKKNYFDFLEIAPDINKKQSYWLPNISVRYKELELSWAKDLEGPETQQIVVQRRDQDPLYTVLPSLDFDNIERQDFRLSYNKYAQKYQMGINGGFNFKNRSVGYKSWRENETGHYTMQAFQSGKVSSANASFYLRYNILTGKKWQLYFSQNSNSYSYQNYSTINDIANKSTTWSSTFTQELSFMWNNLIGISPKYTFSTNRNFNTVKDNPDFIESQYKTHTFGMGLNINPIKGFSLESSYSLENRASGLNARQNFNILNASVFYNINSQSQIKLSGFDILNQNNSNYWGVQGNTTYYVNSIVLRQYFLLGYVHKFNLIKVKD
ncbi:hypothetical protein HMPREF0765_0353 [Sphingobacterium spiritivorum ATCC 33300]|uniref:Outer membrane protein beta-barrel domain-containing protein n=1 Tax=Sphingobacterium spiritivorum ATCC 33300 TaxID=525372 RepID=C2FSP7_SPHSI|nr:carboxypeptidase regulatory-like domain-containing protein [Sphingobacterium spiritivorum]EEI94021.1 hypothetical protein HMPREF0765_0353 [Sphingobacterium spiritivorum ATCC 33300]QQS94311.1 carboxypeptidase regulatory-like domain-containing protein [Sphingobacterium spiritivorum]